MPRAAFVTAIATLCVSDGGERAGASDEDTGEVAVVEVEGGAAKGEEEKGVNE